MPHPAGARLKLAKAPNPAAMIGEAGQARSNVKAMLEAKVRRG